LLVRTYRAIVKVAIYSDKSDDVTENHRGRTSISGIRNYGLFTFPPCIEITLESYTSKRARGSFDESTFLQHHSYRYHPAEAKYFARHCVKYLVSIAL